MIEILPPNDKSELYCWILDYQGDVHVGQARTEEEAENEAIEVLKGL